MNFVALDVGNVLVHINFNPFVEAISRYLNISKDEAQYSVSGSCKMHDLGLTSMETELKDHFKIKSQVMIKDLLLLWNHSISINMSMLEFIGREADNGNFKVALLSNVGLEHSVRMESILNHYHGHNLFDLSIKHLSCHVGARKPTKLYYQSFLSQHPEFQGAAYLDDLKENLAMGAEFGFRPFHFELDKETNEYEHRVKLAKLEEIERFIKNDE